MEEVELRQLDVDMVYTFTYSGNLSPESLGMRLYNDSGRDRLIKFVRGSLGTSPQESSVIVDILCNGETIFSRGINGGTDGYPFEPKVEIDVGSNMNIATPKRPLWKKDDYLTVNIVQIGTTFPGSDLTINVVVSE